MEHETTTLNDLLNVHITNINANIDRMAKQIDCFIDNQNKRNEIITTRLTTIETDSKNKSVWISIIVSIFLTASINYLFKFITH